MKTLQKSLLRIILTVVFVDLLSHLASHEVLTTMVSQQTNTVQTTFWIFTLSLILGSIGAGLLLHYYSHISVVAVALCFIGIIQGIYSLVPSLKVYLYLRVFHGLFLSVILTAVVTWLCSLMEEVSSVEICKYFFTIPLFSLFLLPLYYYFSKAEAFLWTLNILMFAYIFIGVLCLLLMDYMVGFRKRVEAISYRSFKSILSNSILPYHILAISISGYTLATLYHMIINPDVYYIKSSPIILGAVVLASLTLTLITKLGAVEEELGDIKGILMALLLMAFGLGLIPILSKTSSLIIPMILLGISIGILFPSIYGGLRNQQNFASLGLLVGFFHGLLLLGYGVGLTISASMHSQFYSHQFVNSLLIICTSIFFIRRIHQQATSYKI